jgi:hypothetical protein
MTGVSLPSSFSTLTSRSLQNKNIQFTVTKFSVSTDFLKKVSYFSFKIKIRIHVIKYSYT